MSKGHRWTAEELTKRGWRDPNYQRISGLTPGGRCRETPAESISAVIQANPAPKRRKDAAKDFPDFCVRHGLPRPLYDYRFHPKRRWRFDAVWPLEKIAVEIDGSVWTQGRHTRGTGFIGVQQKLNAAVLGGWRVLRYTPDRLDEAMTDLRQLLTVAAI